MYLDHFELKEAPFSITPDPRFVYLTDQHRDALAHLLFGITQGGGGGFVQLTGEVGTGKTTLCRLLMAQVPEHVRIALVLNPMQQPLELLRTICDELHILIPKRNSSIKVLTDALTRYLLESYAAGLRVVLIIDEAQNLSFEALEQVRLLTNLETPTQKLLQIILLGQPELRDVLARNELRQLAQRITARFHLAPLSREETSGYVEHRLAVAGRRRALFSAAALRELHRCTEGYPRAINVVADRALLGAYARSQEVVDDAMVRAAAREVAGSEPSSGFGRAGRHARWLVMVLLLVVALAAMSWKHRQQAFPVTDGAAGASVVPTVVEPTIETAPEGFANADGAADIVAGWWHVVPREGGEDCGRWQPGTALCARLRLNATLLRQLDRPVVLTLQRQGSQHWLVLRRLDERSAQLAAPRRLARQPWQVVDAEWLGDALLVVAAPPGYDGAILAPGASGGLVLWVQAALAAFDDEISTEPGAFQTQTRNRVQRIQAQHGLHADGLVGPETLALLAAFAPTGPRLSDPLSDKAFVSDPQQ